MSTLDVRYKFCMVNTLICPKPLSNIIETLDFKIYVSNQKTKMLNFYSVISLKMLKQNFFVWS